jgi:hypothetical protein
MRAYKMKKFLLIVLAVSISFGFIAEEKNDPKSNKPIAVVKKIVKDVTHKKADKSDWEAASLSVPLRDGEELKTGDKSLALVTFLDKSILRVRENSILKIYGETENKNVKKNTFIEKGLVGFEITPQDQGDEFKFTTPTVVASIRGTGGSIAFDDQDSTTTVRLDSGNVFLQTSTGDQDLSGGNTALINPNGEIQVYSQTEDDKKVNIESQRTNTKKIKVKTPQGDVVIEYYTND